jgi:hypothetical protein
VVPTEWASNTFHNPGDQILDSNGNLQQCTSYSNGLSGASEPAWTGLISITAWSLATAGGTSFTFIANNTNAVGDVIRLSGFRNSLFFNNQTPMSPPPPRPNSRRPWRRSPSGRRFRSRA